MPDNAPSHRRERGAAVPRLEIVLLCAVVALCGAGLAAFSWTRSATAPSVVAYTQTGKLAYTAPTPASSIYGSTGLKTGEPAYLATVSTLQIAYSYQFATSALDHLTGTEQLVAQVSNGQGIVRTVPLQAVTPFSGNTFSTTVPLPLPAIQAIVASFSSDESGAFTSGLATAAVSIAPDIHVSGRLGPVKVKASFDSPAVFTLTSSALTPAGASSSSTPAAPTAGAPTATKASIGQPITSSSSGSVRRPSGQPATLFLGLSVLDARIASLVLLLVGLGAASIFGIPLLRELTSADERVRIATRFHSSLIDVDSLPESSALAIVELSSFDGLVHIGRRLESPLLHLHIDVGDEYAVVDNLTVYRYRVASRPQSEVGHTDGAPSATTTPRRHEPKSTHGVESATVRPTTNGASLARTTSKEPVS